MPAAPNLPTLTLSAPLLSTLQPASYLFHHLSRTNTRPTTGRKPHDVRPLSCTTSSLAHCAGSALVRVGNTAIVCGIQAEQLLHTFVPDPPQERLVPPQSKSEELAREQEDIASLNLLVPNVELNVGGAPGFVAGEGRAPGQLQQSLSVRLLRLLLSSRMIRMQDLLITRGGEEEMEDAEKEKTVGYWVLYITLLPLSLDGTVSLFDALWMALSAALQDVRLPKAWWDADRECVMCSDVAEEASGLQLRSRAVALTFGVFVPGPYIWTARPEDDDDATMNESQEEDQNWTLADPDGFEDGLCDECITVVMDRGRKGMKILGVEKSGGGIIGAGELKQLVPVVEKRWKEVTAVLSNR